MIGEFTEHPSAAELKAADKRADTWRAYFEGESGGDRPHAEELMALAGIAEVQKRHERDLLALDNVVGVAASVKVTKGKPTGEHSLTIYVEEKKPKTQLSKEAVVPDKLGDVATDVVAVGPIRVMAFTAQARPALPGFSMGHKDITAGTLGCVVRDIRRCCCEVEKGCGCSPSREDCKGDYLVLSNNHVLANSNLASPGDHVLQPGAFDGGIYPSDSVATLERFEPIVFGASGYNLVDAAVARPTFSRNINPAIIGVTMPRGVDQAFVGQGVIKVGRTTQVTTGTVIAVNATVAVGGYTGGNTGVFFDQIITTAMSAGGDSGSLLMDRDLNAVGLLFAGSAEITIHNHIANVETALGVRPLTAPRQA
jgi:hypothetical protein